MSKGIIIAAFATCGKTYLEKKYRNAIDLESSTYKFDNTKLVNIPVEERKGTPRKINPDWPSNYYQAIKDAQSKYDIVLVQLKPMHFDYFDRHDIKYSIAYPGLDNWEDVERRCIGRGNNESFVKRLKEVFVPYYEDSIKRNFDKFYILRKGETLEDCLVRNGLLSKEEER